MSAFVDAAREELSKLRGRANCLQQITSCDCRGTSLDQTHRRPEGGRKYRRTALQRGTEAELKRTPSRNSKPYPCLSFCVTNSTILATEAQEAGTHRSFGFYL